MENFRRPLAAHSFTELWRRWHISLTNWFRDYLYIPLGGNRKGKFRQYLNQIIVFLTSGLWHGASLTFVVWGLLNGIYMCVGKPLQAGAKGGKNTTRFTAQGPRVPFFKVACTYLLFTSCIVFFRAATFEDAAWIYGHLFTGWGAMFTDFEAFREVLVTIGFDLKMTLTLLVGLAFTEGLEAFGVPMHEFIRRYPLVLRWLFVLCAGRHDSVLRGVRQIGVHLPELLKGGAADGKRKRRGAAVRCPGR